MRKSRFKGHKRIRKNRRARMIKLLLSFVLAIPLCMALMFVFEKYAPVIDDMLDNKADETTKQITLTDLSDPICDLQVEAILGSMTAEEKVGQMFMGCFYNGTPAGKTVEKYHLGGVLLFGSAFKETPKEKLISRIQAINYADGLDPLIAVDEEGGTVVRVSAYKEYRSEPFKSPRQIYAKGGIDAIVSDAHEKNKLLSDLGINMNLAPVCDISQDPDDFMYWRSLGQDAQTTSIYAAKVARACAEDGIACSLKHFPGYGNSADTHKGLAVDKRPLEELKKRDLLPFQAGIDEGAASIMVSHNIVSSMDDDLPASLSPAVHRILREDMGFDGIIVTDDLSMGAIAKFMPDEESAVTAVLAGNDLLCTGDYVKQYSAVLKALKDGVISEEQVNDSVRRILKLKYDLGMLS